ncbi:hypothetical protein PP935_gp185 [Rhizobium phage RHph_N34]|uniref:Uncharacterized protein n=1 Tax=Rhizobium phage RHph_N34 TaxID=2509586 RepID=A0A7S5RFL1_9CAUD|nr:hypothetical protein PP935_gp185 [Rhizobium phage RHph_N34]QIG73960.1 hypothetical protein EVC06_185 [Rhizobium phage RHph_N34]
MTKIRQSFTTTIVKRLELEIDSEKLTPEIIKEYNEMITYKGDTVEEHLANIAEHYNLENWWNGDTFLEGYGDLKELGVRIISEEIFDIDTEKNYD